MVANRGHIPNGSKTPLDKSKMVDEAGTQDPQSFAEQTRILISEVSRQILGFQERPEKALIAGKLNELMSRNLFDCRDEIP